MSQAKIHLQSFNSGELSETMANRFGVEKVASGCRLMRNMLPHVHGPAVKRPGTTYQGFAGHNTQAPRLLEFNFSATTRFCLEFSTSTIRVWSGQTGALQSLLATVSHPYTYAQTWEVQARQVNDVVYLVHPSHHPRVLTRVADNNWTLAEVDWKYPPLLDDYFTPEQAAPTITTLLEAPLEMAPEWTLPAAPEDPIPSWDSDPSGTADSAWFELDYTLWTTAFPSIAGGVNPTLTLQLVNTAGAWVDAGAVTISLTATPAFRMQYAFQPAATTTSVLVRRRTWTGSTWGAWSTIETVVLTLETGTTAATMPTLSFRLVLGPANIDGSNAHRLTVTGITGIRGTLFDASLVDPGVLRLTRRQQEPVSFAFGRTWTLPGSFPAQQQARWQIFNGTSWATIQQQIISGSIDDAGTLPCRLRRSGANLLLERRGTGGVFAQLGTIAATVNGDWQMRLFIPVANINGTVQFSGGGVGRFESLTGGPDAEEFSIPISRTRSGTGADAGTGGVTVPAGSWQFRAEVFNSSEIPAGARIRLQRRSSGVWANIQSWDIDDAGGIYFYDGAQPSTQLGSNTLIRVLYESTGGARVDGVGQIERVTTAAANDITVRCNAVNGNNRTLTASAALFQAGHVGAFWQIAHRRERSFSEIIGAVGAFPVTRRESKALRIVGRWDVTTYGIWKGDLYLERRPIGGVWQVIRTWSSNKDRNVVAGGDSDQDAEFRLRVAAGLRGFAASGADVPRFVLEAADSRTYGLVRITAVTNETTATCNVIRPLESIEETDSWAEGAFSTVRGFPATLAVHEGRFWYGGTAFQPSALWASVSNDFNNFRRSSNDDGSFVVALAAETGSAIRWLSNADDALLIGTGGEEWAIRSNEEGQPLTPTNIRAGRRGAYSSAPLQARVSQDATLFLQRNRRKLRQASYSSTDGAFQASDMTVLAPHITDAGIVQFAVQQAPWNVIWCVLSDGKLATMTFEREQNVFAWSLHETNGAVKSIAILTGEQTDQIWLSVERAGRAMIERFDSAAMIGGSSGWQSQAFCDSALKLTGPATSFTIAHLPSRAVVGLADGVPFTATTNGSGVFTLAASATTVVVGQAFESLLQPMRIDLQMQDGTSQARRIRVSRVGVRVIDSRSGQVADGTDGTFETLEYSGAGLFSGMVEAAIESRSDVDMNVCVKDSKPLPFTVAALVLKGDVFGD